VLGDKRNSSSSSDRKRHARTSKTRNKLMDPSSAENEPGRVLAARAQSSIFSSRESNSLTALDQVFAVRANVDEFKEILAAEAVIRDANADAAAKRCAFVVLGEYERRKQFCWQPSRRAFKSLAHAAGLRNKAITRAWQQYQRDGKFAAIIAMLSDEERKAARERLIAANERAASANKNEIIPLKQQLRNVAKKGWRPPTEKQKQRAEKAPDTPEAAAMLIGHERSALCYCMSPEARSDDRHEFVRLMTRDVFLSPIHKDIFDAMLDLADDRETINVITVSNRLEENGKLKACGDRRGLSDFAEATTSAEIARSALKLMIEAWHERQAIETGKELSEGDISLQVASDRLVSIIEHQNRDGATPGRSIIDLAQTEPDVFDKDSLLSKRVSRHGNADDRPYARRQVERRAAARYFVVVRARSVRHQASALAQNSARAI
jgi:Replicative DNA helicase